MQDIIQQLEQKRVAARMGGGQKRIDAQHAKGKHSRGCGSALMQA